MAYHPDIKREIAFFGMNQTRHLYETFENGWLD